jgi:tetratricopeptide (TPR) repeat protein
MGQAIENFDRAIELDPRFAVAYGRKGMALWLTGIYHWAEDATAVFREADTMFEQTLALDPHNFEASRVLIFTLWRESRLDEALEMSSRWVAASPDNVTAHRMHAYTLGYRGEYDRALEEMRRSAASIPTGRLDDHDLWFPGMLHLLVGDVGECIRMLKSATFRAPNYLSNHLMLTVALVESGDLARAREQIEKVRRISPDYRAEYLSERLNFRDKSIAVRFVAALRAAGLP